MNPTPVFRRAQPKDAALLSEIARAAKQSWGYPPEWMAAWREVLTIAPDYLNLHPVWIAELGGEPAGFFGLQMIGDDWHLEHLWLRPERIGQGLGRELFAEAVRQARGLGAVELHIKSDPHAEGFYRQMGATRTGQEVYLLLGKIRRELPQLTYRVK